MSSQNFGGAISFPDGTGPNPVIVLTASATINTTTHVGALIGINSSGGAVALTLPSVAAAKGCHYRFYCWYKFNSCSCSS